MVLPQRLANSRKKIVLFIVGIALLVHGVTIIVFIYLVNISVDIGILGGYKILLYNLPDARGIIDYSWSMIVLGVVLIITSYLINELGKKAESTIKTTTDTQTK